MGRIALIAGLAVAGITLLSFGGMQYAKQRAAQHTAKQFMTALSNADVDEMCRHSTRELSRDIRKRAVEKQWSADGEVTHKVESASVDRNTGTVVFHSTAGGFRLQTTTLQLVRVDKKWLVQSGSFRIGERWANRLKAKQQEQADQLFRDLKQAIEAPDAKAG